MTGGGWSRGWRAASSLGAGLLGLAFVAAGGVKLDDPARFADMFAAWGLPPGAAVWSGRVEVILGLVVFWAPTRRYGALGLAAWMLLFAPLQLRAGQTGASLASLAVLALAGALAVVEVRARGWKLRELPTPLASPPPRPAAGVGRAAELVGVSFLIRYAVGGMLFWSALPVLAVFHARAEGRQGVRSLVEPALLHLLVLGVGVSGLWGFVGHFFMSAEVGTSVGWAPSPFQRELAFYHLGLGLAGVLCLWLRNGFWTATGLITVVFAFGAGIVHLQELLATGNTAPANWGPGVFFGNVLIPSALAALLALRGMRSDPSPPYVVSS